MERLARCLSPDEVVAFMSGALGADEVRLLEGHVALCADCRMLLSLVARSDSIAGTLASRGITFGTGSGAPSDASADPSPGTRVGRYVLLERLGAGAMGVVFAAHDPELDRKVAVKVLRGGADEPPPDDADTRDAPAAPTRSIGLLMREAQAMARLAHPNVVAVHDVGWFGDRVFLAMEFVDGQTLAQWLAAERRPLREVIAMFVAAGHGLAAAHAAGLVHRDFKPENVLIGKDGRVRVTDFGLAHRAELPLEPAAAIEAADPRRTARMLAGTPFYMAPEQLTRDRVDARTDQFSFCVALYAALTGKHPFPASGRAQGLPAARPGDAVPSWLWRALRPGLAVDRELRYPAMAPLLARLARGPRRRAWIAAGAAVAAIAGIAAVAWRGSALDAAGPGCEGAEHLLAGIWDRARARTVEDAFRATGHAEAATAFASASLLLDQYAGLWTAMRTGACQRALSGSQSQAGLRLRVACLDARLAELGLLTERLAAADAKLVEGAVLAVEGLGTLDICTDDRALELPTAPEVAARPGALVAVDAEGRRSDFVTDTEGSLIQVRQRPDGGPPDRLFVVDGAVGLPALVTDADQHWQLFARRLNRTVARSWQEQPGGPWKIEYITDQALDDPAPAVIRGQLAFFVHKVDGWVWRYWQDPAAAGQWVAVRVAAAAIGRPGAGVDFKGDLYSLIHKADGTLWAARHPRPGDPPDRPKKLFERIAGDPIVTYDAVDKLSYYVRRNDGSLLAGYQGAAGSPDWYAVILTEGVAGNPAIAFDPEGKQICMSRKTDGTLWSAVQDKPSGGDWHDHILTTGAANDPIAFRGADDRVVYLVRKTDGTLWQGEQDAPLSTTWHERAVP
jgi:hypothetical protein